MAVYNSTNTGAEVDSAVDAVQLAKAATSTDATADRLLKLGDFGLGLKSTLEYPKSSIDDASCPSGFYRAISTNPASGTRPTGFSLFGYIQVYTYDSDDKMQVFTDVNGHAAFRVLKTSGNTDWVKFATSENNALIEEGSNANGSYTKFPDGTLICRATRSYTLDILTPAGVLYKSNGTAWNFPSTFLSRPVLSGLVVSADNTSILNVKFRSSATPASSSEFVVTNSESTTNISADADLMAIGRWK